MIKRSIKMAISLFAFWAGGLLLCEFGACVAGAAGVILCYYSCKSLWEVIDCE
jgi:hypothetical protein